MEIAYEGNHMHELQLQESSLSYAISINDFSYHGMLSTHLRGSLCNSGLLDLA